MDFLKMAQGLVSQMTLEEKIAQMQYEAPAIERLGVPAYTWWNEALHGVARAGTATVFPQAIAMAATFDTDEMFNVASAISDEARAKYNEYKKFGSTEIYQGLTFWSPNINIFRDPRWGRGQETYGEDPYLTAQMGTAFVKGLQGNGKYRKADATLKHFAVHSGPESLRHSFDAVVSQKDLYETYLSAFRYCIEHADPSAVMGAYNRTNGEPCCGSETLLKGILYGEWGFRGYVVSDCGAIWDIHTNHRLTKNAAESSALAVNCGCDLNCGKMYFYLADAVKEGLISEETITHSVEKLFEARYRLGMFADDCEYDKIPYDTVGCKKHRELNRRMAQKSMVLLKNEGVLPLKDDMTVAVIGPLADDVSILTGNYNGTPARYTTLLQGITEASRGRVIYAKGSHLFRDSFDDRAIFPVREAIIAARHADAVVLCLGINPSMEGEEGADAFNNKLCGDRADIDIPAIQQELLEAVAAEGKPTVLVNVSGSCINLSYAKEHIGAILQCFYPGAEGGHALADILFGKTSPSGRLPVSFYRSVEDLPPFEDYSMENRTYKFFRGECVYNFGDGLTYSEIKENWIGENTVEVENSGDFDTDYSVLKFEYIPHKNLCGIKHIHLKKGETKTVSFEE